MKLETGVLNSGYYFATIIEGNEVTEMQESIEDGINRSNTIELSEKRIELLKKNLLEKYNESKHCYTLTI